jgi:hypothetical protein
MATWVISSLFAGVALAHSGVKSLVIDGIFYPPFDSRIDHLLEPVRRIEWSHDVVVTTFNPITNFSDPSLACRPFCAVINSRLIAFRSGELTATRA